MKDLSMMRKVARWQVPDLEKALSSNMETHYKLDLLGDDDTVTSSKNYVIDDNEPNPEPRRRRVRNSVL